MAIWDPNKRRPDRTPGVTEQTRNRNRLYTNPIRRLKARTKK
jgi:hypothetical protein